MMNDAMTDDGALSEDFWVQLRGEDDDASTEALAFAFRLACDDVFWATIGAAEPSIHFNRQTGMPFVSDNQAVEAIVRCSRCPDPELVAAVRRLWGGEILSEGDQWLILGCPVGQLHPRVWARFVL